MRLDGMKIVFVDGFTINGLEEETTLGFAQLASIAEAFGEGSAFGESSEFSGCGAPPVCSSVRTNFRSALSHEYVAFTLIPRELS